MRFARTARSVVLLAAVLSSPLAAIVGCKDPAPIPTVGSDLRRVLMKPDDETKVRELIELANKSKAGYDLPTMRQALVEATQSAQKLENHVVAAELLTTVSELMVKEEWTRESERAITAARIAATSISDAELSKKVAALTNLALAMQRAGDKQTAGSIILEADRIVNAVSEPEQRVPQMVALHCAWIKLGDTKKPEDELKPSEAQLAAARELIVKIEDPAKLTQAEFNSAAEAFRGDRPALGREFYSAAITSSAKIADPLVKAKTLVDLYEILHPFRNNVPIELPLQTAVDATVHIPSGSEKQALLARIEKLVPSLKPSAAALNAPPPAPKPAATPSVTPPASATATPTGTATPTASATATATPTATAAPTPSASATATPTATPTASATATPSGNPKPTASPTASR